MNSSSALQLAEKDQRQFTPDMEKPAGVPVAFADYIKMMFDLQVLAFQADVTRVSTLLFGREASVRTYNEIGVSDPHHPLSHHRNLPDMIEKITKINTYHVSLFAYFLEKLKATKDGDGSLLDHSMIVYGGAICDGNSHSHKDLPVLLAGRGDGRLKPGRTCSVREGHADDEPVSLVTRADERADGTSRRQHRPTTAPERTVGQLRRRTTSISICAPLSSRAISTVVFAGR